VRDASGSVRWKANRTDFMPTVRNPHNPHIVLAPMFFRRGEAVL